MRPQLEVDEVLARSREGMNASEIAHHTSIPRSTIRGWLKTTRPPNRRRTCPRHDLSPLNEPAYAYLLGMYLGDGCISLHRRDVWRLRITLDSAYPEIVGECVRAVCSVSHGRAGATPRRGSRAVDVSSYWKHWVCLIPQHGPGRKHTRPIVLADWQERIVAAHTEEFLRGLIHSDGTRIIATERKGANVRPATASQTGRKTFSDCSVLPAKGLAFTAHGRATSRSRSTARPPSRG